MKKNMLVILFTVTFMTCIYPEDLKNNIEHFLGMGFDLNQNTQNFAFLPYVFNYSGNFHYKIKFNFKKSKNYFELENNLLIKYRMHLFYGIHNSFIVTFSGYPTFNFGKNLVYFFISLPSIKMDVFIFEHTAYHSDFSSNTYYDMRYFPSLQICISSKIGFSIFLGKNKNIILTPFYGFFDHNLFIDFKGTYFTFSTEYPISPTYCFYTWGFGSGSMISFKIEKLKK